MRLRRRRRGADAACTVLDSSESPDANPEEQQSDDIKLAKPDKGFQTPLRLIRNVMNNPNFSFQLMVIILTLTSENIKMDRRIDGMTSTVDRVRSIAEVINSTMNSVKVAAEAPKTIRRLLE